MTEPLEARTLLSTYDAVADFSTAANPNGVWSYGELPAETAVSAFSLYPTAGGLDFGATGWSTGSGSPPYVGVNNTGSPITGRGVTLPSGDLAMHPGATGEYSDTRFTVPGAGPVSTTFTFAGLETGTSTDVHVLYDGVSMADGAITAYSTYSSTITIPNAAAGDTLDFVVGYGSDQSYIGDATSLTAQVTASGNKLAFIQSPSDTAVNAVIKPPITVEVEDSSGNFQTTASDSVTLGIQSGSGTLKGTLTEPAINGLATFSDLSIDQGGDYFLKATDTSDPNTDSGVSNQFKITAGKLVFAPAPMNGSVDSPLKTIKVKLEDDKNKLITDADGTVVTLTPTGLLSGSEISGNTAILSGGVATFSNVVLQKPGTYQLQADDGADAVATSGKFKIASLHLSFTQQPSNPAVGEIIPLQVELRDTHNVLTTTGDSASDVLEPVITPDVAAHSVTPAGALQDGVYLASEANGGVIISKPGSYKITYEAYSVDASTGELTPDPDLAPVTSAKFRVLGLHLAFTKQPTTSSSGSIIPLEVSLLDSHRELATTSGSANDILNATVTPLPTGGAITPTLMLQGGVYTASDDTGGVIISKPGIYTITFTAEQLDSTTGNYVDDASVDAVKSVKFKVQGEHLAFAVQPSNASAGHIIPLEVDLLDAHNAPVTTGSSASDLIEAVVTPAPSGGAITPASQLQNGTYTASEANGGVIITKPGTYTITYTALTLDTSTGDMIDDPEVQAIKSVNLKVS